MTAKGPAGRWHLATPPVYLLLIGLLLYLQFGGVRQTRQSVLGLEVTISTTRGLLGKQQVRDVTVRYGELRIPLGSGGGVTLRDETGAVERLRPTGAQLSDVGVVVTLGSRLELDFESDGPRMKVDARPLDALPAGLELTLPLRIESSTPVRSLPGLPVLSTRTDGCTLYVTATEGSTLETRHAVVKVPSGERTGLLRVEPCTRVEDPYEYWFTQGDVNADAATYEDTVADFVRRSYPAWQARLYMAGVDPVARDDLVVSYLAETLARGGYAAAQTYLQGRVVGLLGPESSASPLPAAYLGLAQAYLEAGERRARAQLEEIRSAVGRGDETVFQVPDLLDTVLDHGATSLVDQLLGVASRLALDSSPADLLVDVAKFYVDAQDALGDTVAVRARLEDILVSRVIPSLRKTPAGVFFLPDPGRGERLIRTLDVGRLLADASRILDRDSLVLVGRLLTVSALALASGDGNLPDRIRYESGRLVRSPELLGSEAVYALIVSSERLPRQKPLPRELGSGAWILTAARLRDVVSEAGSLRLSHAFPLGQSHYLVLQGVPELRSVLLHGLAWRPDPEYFRYTDGWWYAPETRTLYVKITQQREWEELALQFSPA